MRCLRSGWHFESLTKPITEYMIFENLACAQLQIKTIFINLNVISANVVICRKILALDIYARANMLARTHFLFL